MMCMAGVCMTGVQGWCQWLICICITGVVSLMCIAGVLWLMCIAGVRMTGVCITDMRFCCVHDWCRWVMCMADVQDRCAWLMCVTIVLDCCAWLGCMTVVRDWGAWLGCMTGVRDCCAGLVFVAVVKPVLFAEEKRFSRFRLHSTTQNNEYPLPYFIENILYFGN